MIYKASIFFILVFAYGCVQKTYNKTVVYLLNVGKQTQVRNVSIRGGDKPLNWQYDTKMTAVIPDSLYKVVVTYTTGYKFTEVKFVVNDEFELKDQSNRRIIFSNKDTTIYTAVFNTMK
jgi:hypothetical protein